GNLEQARSCVIKAHALYVLRGDRFAETAALDKLGNLEVSAGQVQRAIEIHHQTARFFRERGAHWQESRALSGLGLSLRQHGEFDAAREAHTRALEIARTIGDRAGEWAETVTLASVAFDEGDADRAV